MKVNLFPLSLLFVGAWMPYGAALAAPGDASQPQAQPVYESSIGGVLPPSSLPGRVGQGYLVFQKWCAGCHAAVFGPTASTPLGTQLLEQRYRGALPAALAPRTDLTAEAIGFVVRKGMNAMPAFRKTEISDSELTALSAYLTRNAAQT